MGDYISIGEALLITGISMVAVFATLILISFLINGLRIVSQDKKKNNDNNNKLDKPMEVAKAPVKEVSEEVTGALSDEIIAVITAAIAAQMQTNIPELRIRSIRKLPLDINPWALSGKRYN